VSDTQYGRSTWPWKVNVYSRNMVEDPYMEEFVVHAAHRAEAKQRVANLDEVPDNVTYDALLHKPAEQRDLNIASQEVGNFIVGATFTVLAVAAAYAVAYPFLKVGEAVSGGEQ
jgi:hypothetical protein